MSLYFEELDYRPTPIGPISLRRRRELSLGVDVFEIMLGDEHLMSSLFTASEIALAELVLVVDMLEAVIDWHRAGLLPLGTEVADDSRCTLVQGDFFAGAASTAGFDPDAPGRRFDAILVDIDHSPEALLDDRSASFYGPEGLGALAAHLKPGGIFSLWSNDKPDPAFTERLSEVFAEAWAEPVTFHNPLQDLPFTQTVYLARTAVPNERI